MDPEEQQRQDRIQDIMDERAARLRPTYEASEDDTEEEAKKKADMTATLNEQSPSTKPQKVIQPEVVEEEPEESQTKDKGLSGMKTPFNMFRGDPGFLGLKNPLYIPTAMGMGLLDFPIDVLTKITGTEKLDNKWDEFTKFENPWGQRIRKFSSVVIPTLVPVMRWGKFVNASKLTGLSKAFAHIGGAAAIDSAVIGFSDVGEEDNTLRVIADTFPGSFGTQGAFPIPESWKTLDGDSPQVRRQKNMLESGMLSGAADILGYAMQGMKPSMHWFKPLDDKAKGYKAVQEAKAYDPESIVAIADIQHRLKTDKTLKKADRKKLEIQLAKLKKQVRDTGYSEATTVPIESYTKRVDKTRTNQTANVASKKLASMNYKPGQWLPYDPDIVPGLANKAKTARQSVPPGNIPRAMNDAAVLKLGKNTGDPTPLGKAIDPAMVTDPMMAKGLDVPQSVRHLVARIWEKAKAAGNYQYIVDTIRMSNAEMDKAHWVLYDSIVRPGTKSDLKKFLLEWSDEKSLAIGPDGKRIPIRVIDENIAPVVGKAMQDLTRLYLGKGVTKTSAVVMDSLGREISTIAEGSMAYKELVDNDRVFEMVMDKLEVLGVEYGLNKYISGFTLRNKQWWNKLNGEQVLAKLDEFNGRQDALHTQFKKFRDNLTELKDTNPSLMRPLMEAYAYSGGDVISINSLNKWANEQVSVMGLLKSPDPTKLNMFARGAWSVVYNNVLSGLSGIRAAFGNGTRIILKPIESLLGHGIEALMKGDFELVRKSMYVHASYMETTRRAIGDGIKRMKMVHNDPEFLAKAIREDYRVADDNTWLLLDDMAEQWKKDGNWGAQFQYGWAKANWQISKAKWMRTGTTLMTGVDSMTDTFMATALARSRAYDEVITATGKTLDSKGVAKALEAAERKHFRSVFDNQGLLTDEYAKYASGEIALNLDDNVSAWINQSTTAVPALKNFFMFPRTGINMFKVALSYTPLSLIPGLNKYSEVLLAGDDIVKIKDALKHHGIKEFDKTPNAMAIYKNLKNEYAGRLALSGMTAVAMYNWAMAGNLRGNGPSSGSERKKLQDKGWRPKTINIGGAWFNYDGLPMIETVFKLMGYLAYYQNDLGAEVTQDFIDKITWSLGATYLNNTPLYGLEPLQAAMSGDTAAWQRMTANIVRGAIPMSGALGVVSNAITSSQKDIYKDLLGYVTNRVPIASSFLPERIDYWTGQPINEIDNPLLRTLNAISPIKVSGGQEPWRKWLLETGYPGLSMVTTTSKGRKRLSAQQRELIGRYIGEQQLYKEVEKMMKNRAFNEEIKMLKELRKKGMSYEEIEIRAADTRVYRALNRLMSQARTRAEAKLRETKPYLDMQINKQLQVDKLTQQGNIPEASRQRESFLNFHRK